MRTVFIAGILYFVLVFAAGFVLGVLRVLLLVPVMGETAAVLVELPFMLAISVLVARRLIRRLAVPPSLGPRLAMGTLAFALLMAAEAGISVFAFGYSLNEHAALVLRPSALPGLIAQIVFAGLPALLLLRREEGG